MPRSNRPNTKVTSSMPIFPEQNVNKPKFNVRSRRKSNTFKKPSNAHIKSSNTLLKSNRISSWKSTNSSSDSELSTHSLNPLQIPSHNTYTTPSPKSPSLTPLDTNISDINNVLPPYLSPYTQTHLKQHKQYKKKSKLSGRKRKRSLGYHSDFDNKSQYENKNNNIDTESVNISYNLPQSQRYNNINKSVSNGDDIYLIFQEYYKKYTQCKPIIDAINQLLNIND
eukprot:451368_1